MHRSALSPKLCIVLFLLTSFGRNGASSSSPSPPSFPTAADSRASGADRFVQAAPLIVGVKCSDGVILLAAHTPDDEEPLLYYRPSPAPSSSAPGGRGPSNAQLEEELGGTTVGGFPAAATEAGSQSTSSLENAGIAGSSFRDLPPGYGGPFRVLAVDPRSGLALALTGWRADCDAAARKARALAARERSRYHRHGLAAAAGEQAEEERAMGIVVSQDLALHFAKCAASLSTRTLSCAGLMATPSALWLIDATGAVPVRALCVGGGAVGVGGDGAKGAASQSIAAASELVNRRLAQVADWTSIDCHRALRRLLRILEDPSNGDAGELLGGGNSHGPSAVRRGTRLEVAFVRRSGVERQSLEEAELVQTSAV